MPYRTSMEIVPINGPDDLREVTRGADLEIVQLKPGKLQGVIKHVSVGNLVISQGQFNSEVRLRGTMHQDRGRIVIGTILDGAGHNTQWWHDVQPGDIGVFPPLVEFDAIHAGATSYLGVSIPLEGLTSILTSEMHLADPAFWNTKRVSNTDPLIRVEMLQQFMGIISGIEQKFTAPSVDFLERSIIESFVVGLVSSLPQGSARSYTGARLVSETEDYIDATGGRPVHISELCSVLKVSRRSLHRAFTETLGIGPAAYLRFRRLSAIQSVLRRSDPATTSISALAQEYGFPDRGRFTSYYRAHFGETPSRTLRTRRVERCN